MIDNKTQLNAVIGFPLGHSQSPHLHNAIYKKLGVNAVLIAIPHKNIARLVEVIKTANIGLTVVTMPFKQAIMPFLDKVDKQAKAINAVNTVINSQGKLTGFNTDIDGIASALAGVQLRGKNVLLLGAGGVARAVAYYLKGKKAKIFYANRTAEKAKILQTEFGGYVVKLSEINPDEIDVIINATPIGMYPNIKQMPVPKSFLRKKHFVFDVVYNLGSTELLKQAKIAGARVVSGMDMFIGQALKQIQIYSGKNTKSLAIKKYAKNIVIKNI